MNSKTPARDSITFPNGFLDFLTDGERRHQLGEHEIDPQRLAHFNDVMHEISPQSPSLTQDQIATAGRRMLERHAEGGKSNFVQSRLAVLTRLQELVDDRDWSPGDGVRETYQTLQRYRSDPESLLPSSLPVLGELDDAVLVDIALQRLRDELADYEDFCRFRQVAAAFAAVPVAETGLTREHWLEAMLQSGAGHERLDQNGRSTSESFIPDPRASLFHIT